MSRSTRYYTTKTIASWDEAAPRHDAINASLVERVGEPGFNNLNPDFDALVDRYGVSGRAVVQVCCNNGIDLLSLRNKGAGRCLGIDGSSAFIEQAARLARAAGHPDIEYLCTDIYDLPDSCRGGFDLAVTTVGVLGWMPDLPRFLEICASLLVPGGHLLVEELHPILGMYEEGEPSYLRYSYFKETPYVDSGGLDYFTHEKYDARENYAFHHSMSEILMSALAAGLRLEHVRELGYNIGNFCADLEFIESNPPLGINFAWKKIA